MSLLTCLPLLHYVLVHDAAVIVKLNDRRPDLNALMLLQGPSSEALHLGHLVPFMFTKYLQVGG
jgi:hypothetical protein